MKGSGVMLHNNKTAHALRLIMNNSRVQRYGELQGELQGELPRTVPIIQ